MSKTRDDADQNINVFVRCRPLNDNEKKSAQYSIVQVVPEKREIIVKEKSGYSATTKTFNFDRVFTSQSKQLEVYKSVVQPLLDEILLGYNCTVFAYGQTGTGKTFTMEGERSNDAALSWENDPLAGIIPRAMSQLFSRLQSQSIEYTVRVSYLEIYNEELIDLLGAQTSVNPRLKIYEDTVKKGSCVIQGLEEVLVRDKHDVYDILNEGSAKRQTAATNINAHSSRSHTLFMVTVHMKESTTEGEEMLKVGKLNLVDLAGSECIGRSGAIANRAREAGSINQSLLTLGRVITALVEHGPHIPYRESKLTRLLRDSLGGKTKTSIIATITPASGNLEETLNTLDYAHRAKNVTNKPEINQKMCKKVVLKEYGDEIERLRKDLQASRDRNGVYVAHENYEAMQNEIIQKRELLREEQEKLQCLLLEKMKLEDLFTETKLELEEKSDKLEETSNELCKTRDNLFQAKVSLAHTRASRNAKVHIIEKQTDTEEKLTSQATELLQTVDVSLSHVDKLHEKVDRTKNTEDQNLSRGEQFLKQFSNEYESMHEKLNRLDEIFSQNIDLCYERTCFISTKNAEKYSETMSTLTNLFAELESHHLKTNSYFNQIEEFGIKYVNDNANQMKKDTDNELSLINVNWNVLKNDMESISNNVQKQFLICNDLTKCLKEQHEEMQNQRIVYQTQVQKLMSTCKNNIAKNLEDFLNDLENHAKTATEISNDQADINHSCLEATSDLTDIQTFISAQLNQLNNICQTKFSNFNEKLTSINNKNRQIIDKNVKHVELFDETKKHVVEKFKILDGNVNSIESINKDNNDDEISYCNRYLNDNCAIITEATTNLEKHNEKICSITDKVNESFSNRIKFFELQNKKRSDCDNVFLCDFKNRFNDMSLMDKKNKEDESNIISNLKESVQNVNNNMQSELVVLNSKIESVTKVQNEMAKYANDNLSQNVNKIEKFLENDIKKTVITGMTPVRTVFRYPKEFSKTEHHNILEEDFRSTYDINVLPIEMPSKDMSDILNPVLNDDDNFNNDIETSAPINSIEPLFPKLNFDDNIDEDEYQKDNLSTNGSNSISNRSPRSSSASEASSSIKENIEPKSKPTTTKFKKPKNINKPLSESKFKTPTQIEKRMKKPLSNKK